jgi:hypothetical protein
MAIKLTIIIFSYKPATKVIRKVMDKLVLKQKIDITVVSTTTFHPSYRKKMNQLSGLRWLILKIMVP